MDHRLFKDAGGTWTQVKISENHYRKHFCAKMKVHIMFD